MNDTNKPEVLQQIVGLNAKLRMLGIEPEQLSKIKELVEEYSSLRLDLENYRESQFLDDAHELIYQMSGRGDKNGKAAGFLRTFAEHVASFIIGREGPIVDLVDEILPMHQMTKE